MAVKWYSLEHATIVGPLTTSQFRERAAQGRIDQNTSVRRGSQGEWIPAGRVKGLFDAPSKSDPLNDKDEENASAGGMSRRFLIGIFALPVIAVIVGLVFIVIHNKLKEYSRIDTANVEVGQAVARAQMWLANGNARESDDIESGLVSFLANEWVSDKADGEAALQQVQTRIAEIAADKTLDEAKHFLDQDQLPTALAKLKLYFADPRATKKHEAQKLMNEIEAANSLDAAIATLVGLSDEEYQRFRQDKQLQDGKATHPGLAKKRNANLISALPKADVMREEIRRKADEEREEIKRKAEEGRQARQEERKRKADEERLARLAAEKRAQEERDRLARLKREEQEEERRKRLAPAVAIDKVLHADAEIVFTVNLHQLLGSVLFKKNEQLAKDFVPKLIKDITPYEPSDLLACLDPFNDLDRLSWSSRGDPKNPRELGILHGNFDVAKFKAKMAEARAVLPGTVNVLGPGTVKTHKAPNGLGGENLVYERSSGLFIALAGNNVFLFSRYKDDLVDDLKKLSLKDPPGIRNKDAQTLLEKMDDKQCLTIAGRVSAVLSETRTNKWISDIRNMFLILVRGAGLTEEEALGKLDSMNFGVTVTDKIKFEILVSTKTPEAAMEIDKRVTDQVKPFRDLGSGPTIDNVSRDDAQFYFLLDIMRAVRSSSKDKLVTITAEVGTKYLEMAFDKDK